MDELKKMDELFDRLYPLCRSITGEGLRQSLDIISEYMPLERISFKTGEKVLNWTVPEEWVIRDAWIKDEQGNKIIDFKESNLHIVNYSIPVHQKMSLEELKKHLHTLEHLPEAIPYVTSYYDKQWGFCMKYEQYQALRPGMYEVMIDSDFKNGTLDVAHTSIKGENQKEILLSSYLCHPSMANNELSGPIALAMLYQRIKKWDKHHLTYRFVLNPETIGSIAYLSKYGVELKETMHSGMVLTCLGGRDIPLRYKASRRENIPLDELVDHMKQRGGIDVKKYKFIPINGSDERQYCSPGFNLPMGQIAKLAYGVYKEYHTSLDNKELMGIENVQKSVDDIEKVLKALDYDGYYINKYPYGEIKLGDYDLYPKVNSYQTRENTNDSILDRREVLNCVLGILNYSDGHYKLSEIAENLWISILKLIPIVEMLKEKDLLEGPYFEKGEKTI